MRRLRLPATVTGWHVARGLLLGAALGLLLPAVASAHADLASAEPALSGGAVTTALYSELALTAQTLWLGALLVDVVVLGLARRAAEASERHLALAATRRLLWLARGALVLALGALVSEVLSLALQGTGDDWARAVAPETIGGMLGSQ